MALVTVPHLGEGIEKAVISFWYFKENDSVGAQEDLVELATDKATFNLPAPVSGKLIKVFYNEGDTVKVGDTVAELQEE